MPKVTHQVPETYSSITRPVVTEVTRALIDLMGLPRDTRLQFQGAAETVAQGGVTINSPQDRRVRFPFDGKVTIEAVEREIEDRVLTQAVKQDDTTFVFWDSALDVYIKPVYVGTEVTISFRYRAPSRTVANNWRDEFRHRAAQTRDAILSEASYHYGFPDSFLLILNEIYTLRERVAPYGETIKEWFRSCASSKITKLVNQAGERPHLVIGETQIAILGRFDFVVAPDQPDKADDGASWECGFDYIFNYDKPISTVMHYPIVVHNQLIGQKFRPDKPHYQLGRRTKYPSHSRFLLDQFTGKYLYPNWEDLTAGVMIPVYDEWTPAYVAPYTSTLLAILCNVDLDNPRDVLNLGQLGDYDFDPDVLEFLRVEAPFMGTLYHSIFHLSMFRWYEPLVDGAISTDAQTLNVSTRIDMDPRQMYHVRMGIVNKLSMLTPEAIERLRENGKAAIKIIQALDPNIDIPKLLGDKIIPRKDINKIIDAVDGVNGPGQQRQVRHMYTVGVYGIIAHREPKPDAHPQSE